MRLRAFALVLMLPACSTDTFEGSDGSVDDGGNDVTLDASSDGGGGHAEGSANDAITPFDGSVPLCKFDGGTACGVAASDCAPAPCCITLADLATCGAITQCNIDLACMRPSDCDGGNVCCVTPTTAGDKCPHVLTGGASACVAPANCAQSGTFRACTTDNDCGNGGACKRAAYADAGVVLGICM